MADFTVSYINGVSGSGVNPSRPVVDDSSLVGLSLLGGVVGGLGGAAKNYAAVKAERDEKARLEAIQNEQDQAVSTFARRQLQLVDATEMGDLSSAEARMRMRANLSRAIADNPALSVELGKAHTSIVKTTGLGQVVYEGTEEENQQLSLEREAVKAGWARPDQSPAEKQAGVDAYMQFQRSQEILKAQKQQLEYATAQITHGTAGINQQAAKLRLVEQNNRMQSQQALGAGTQAYSVKFGNELEGIRQARERGEITAEQAVMLADQSWVNISQVVTQIGSNAGTDYVNNLTKPMEMQYSNYKKYLSGETRLETLKNDNDIAIGIQTKLATGDPEMARLAAISKVFPNSDLITMADVNNKVTDYLKKGMSDKKPMDVLPDFDEDKQSLQTYFGMVSDTMRKVNAGSALDKDETRIEVNTHLNSVLRGLDVYGPSASNPADYKSVIDFLSKSEVGRFVSTQGGFQDSAAATQAARVLQYQYDTTLIPLIQGEWERTDIRAVTVTPTLDYRNPDVKVDDIGRTSEVIKPQFVGSGVTFVAEPGVNDYATRRKVRELNDKISPMLNKMIRTQAHLSGNTDYKSVWVNQYEGKVFGMKDQGAEE